MMRGGQRSSEMRIRISWRVLLLVPVVAFLASCGVQTYQERLSNTSKYFEYLNTLDTLLANPQVVGGDLGELATLRVPQHFELIPEPPLQYDDQGNVLPLLDDPRQPDYLTITLPGLIGAWRGLVRIGEQSENVTAPAYMYVLTNHEAWLMDDAEEIAMAFHGDIVQELVSVLDVGFPSADDWEEMIVPPPERPDRYVEERAFQSLIFRSDQPVQGRLVDVEVHLFMTGPDEEILGAVLFVLPRDISASERMETRIGYCLETLEVSDQKPAAAAVRDGNSGPEF